MLTTWQKSLSLGVVDGNILAICAYFAEVELELPENNPRFDFSMMDNKYGNGRLLRPSFLCFIVMNFITLNE